MAATSMPPGLGFLLEHGDLVAQHATGCGRRVRPGRAGADDGDARGVRAVAGSTVACRRTGSTRSTTKRLRCGWRWARRPWCRSGRRVSQGWLQTRAQTDGNGIGRADGAVGLLVFAAGDVGHVAPDLGAHRAAGLAGRAHQLPAGAGRAAALVDVGLVLVPEPLAGWTAPGSARSGPGRTGELRRMLSPSSWRCMTPCTRSRASMPSSLLAVLGDGLEDLQHAARAFAAGDALAAALGLDELHEELGEVHHAGVLVQRPPGRRSP